MATKECVACAESIQENAKLCRFCSTQQNDRRFAPQPEPAIRTVSSAQYSLNALESQEKVCSKCNKYIIGSDFYDSCEVCRGVATEGVLPGARQESTQIVVSSNADVYPFGQTHLAPTPGIAIVAIIFAFFVPVIGLVLGYSARTEVRNPVNPKQGDGLATAAIIIGWFWLAIGLLWVFAISTAAATNSTTY